MGKIIAKITRSEINGQKPGYRFNDAVSRENTIYLSVETLHLEKANKYDYIVLRYNRKAYVFIVVGFDTMKSAENLPDEKYWIDRGLLDLALANGNFLKVKFIEAVELEVYGISPTDQAIKIKGEGLKKFKENYNVSE